MRFVKRALDSESELPNISAIDDEVFSSSYPALAEYLFCDRWDDATPRRTATLLIFVEDGLWKGCLNDRENERSCWASEQTYEGLLQSLDGRLASGTAEWRRSDKRGSQGKSGKSR